MKLRRGRADLGGRKSGRNERGLMMHAAKKVDSLVKVSSLKEYYTQKSEIRLDVERQTRYHENQSPGKQKVK